MPNLPRGSLPVSGIMQVRCIMEAHYLTCIEVLYPVSDIIEVHDLTCIEVLHPVSDTMEVQG